MLVKPENKAMLTKILTYHVVPGNLDGKAIMKAIKKGKGMATLTTVSGDTLDRDDERRQRRVER